MARKLTTEQFIINAKATHGDTYTYTKSVYTLSRDPIVITCRVHGDFTQSQAGAHINGQGCPKCAGMASYEPAVFIARMRVTHRDKYTYVLPPTLKADSTITITCPQHGVFTQRASSHSDGVGCVQCQHDNASSTFQQFTTKAHLVHNEKYAYYEHDFELRSKDVKVYCKEHGQFTQKKSNHLRGHGCPRCYVPGFNVSKPGVLYYLKVETTDNTLWKIGITNRTVYARFTAKDLKKLSVLYQHTFANGADARALEKHLLAEYVQYKYTGPPILRDGNTELFTSDITINSI